MAVVRDMLHATEGAFRASRAGEPPPVDAPASALRAMARIMSHDWPAGAQYQAIALLAAAIRGWSTECGRSEDEIIAAIASNHPN